MEKLPTSWMAMAAERLVVTFKPVVLRKDAFSQEDWEYLTAATPEQREEFLNENWAGYVDPALPEVEKTFLLK